MIRRLLVLTAHPVFADCRLRNAAAIVAVLMLHQTASSLAAADEPRPIDLVGREAAVICEVIEPKANWDAFRQGELFRRFVKTGFHDELLKTPAFRQWQKMETAVAAATGHPLSSQLLDLCSEEVVLAAYLSSEHQPQGVLISLAENSAAVDRFLQSWKTLEPNVTAQPLKHQGQTYFLRPASAGRKANLFYVAFGATFAVSDHESRIQQVIELRQSAAGKSPAGPQRVAQHPAFRRAAPEADDVRSTIRVLLFARAWDSVWQAAPKEDAGARLLSRIWQSLDSVTLDVRTSDGLHVELRGLIDVDQTSERWKTWSSPVPDPRAFLQRIPADTVLVMAGGIHFQPFWETVGELASEDDRRGWNQGRRVLRGILGGRDFFDDVLPALTQQIELYVVPLRTSKETVPFDAVLTVQLPETERTTDLHLSLDQALSSLLTLLAVQSAEKFPDDEPASVRVELTADTITRWLQTPLPFRAAYQATPSTLRVSRTKDRLHEEERSAGHPDDAAFSALAERWFSPADILVGVNLRRLREHSVPEFMSGILARPGSAESPARPHPLRALELGDLLYLTAQFEPAQLSLRLGLVAESR